MVPTLTRRPRNLGIPQAAAILYGDLGTSKAYVIGLAFAIGGYSSFWLMAAMGILTALVGINYMTICRHHPDGGGVYASVRNRSEILSIIGAFLIIADYMVTAAISALAAFIYLGVPHAQIAAALIILFIAGINYFGPRSTGSLAAVVAIAAVSVVVLLGIFCMPHLGQAVANLKPLSGGILKNWNGLVGVVLALSGIEAVANSTGVMRLNKGSTYEHPCVSRTSTAAITWVLIEVCFFTVLFALAVNALSGLVIINGEVNAPDTPGVRDYMLRYMAEVFVTHSLGDLAGQVAGYVVSIVFGILLLSAVNTAIVDLISISFLMSRDGELPAIFQRLNLYGVPLMGMAVAGLVPAALVYTVNDMSGLADLYAVGVVGAIATNLGATATNTKLHMLLWERLLMLFTFVLMLAIEVSLLIDKPRARIFVVTLLAIGLVLRGLAREFKQRSEMTLVKTSKIAPTAAPSTQKLSIKNSRAPLLCAVRQVGYPLDFAINEARDTQRPLYILYIHKIPVVSHTDLSHNWREDPQACQIYNHAIAIAQGYPIHWRYSLSEYPAKTIVDTATALGASHVVLGASTRHRLAQIIGGNVLRDVARLLPAHVHLIICT